MDASRARRLAVIDLGSNAARLVIMHAMPGYSYHLVDQARDVVRLRQGMTAEGRHRGDIGGGSVGISDVRESFFRAGASATLGALALTDQFAESDPVAGEKYHRIASEIARQLDTVAWLPEKRGERLIRIMIYCWTMTMRCFSSA